MRKHWMLATAVAIGSLVAGAGHARADVFAFKDLDGFDKCMQLDHLVESIKTDKGEQSRFLEQPEIQVRCVEVAAKLIASSKDKALGIAMVESTKRFASVSLAVDLVGPLADVAVTACNELTVYEVLMHPLSDSTDDASDLKKSRGAIKRCLKDASFAKDFMEEKDSGEGKRAARACQILAEEKLVKSCPGGKP